MGARAEIDLLSTDAKSLGGADKDSANCVGSHPWSTGRCNGERTVTIKNSIPPGVIADHGKRLFGNTIRSAEGRELVERLNAMFERANSVGQVVNQRELSTLLSAPRFEGSPSDRSIPATDRLMHATEGLSYESLSLLIRAAEHLLRSEGVHVDSTPFA